MVCVVCVVWVLRAACCVLRAACCVLSAQDIYICMYIYIKDVMFLDKYDLSCGLVVVLDLVFLRC